MSGSVLLPCLWLRGLLPADMCLPFPIPKPQLEDIFYFFDPFQLAPDPHVWPSGLYGTDASGGKYGSFPELRRCGCSAVMLDSMDSPLLCAFWCFFPFDRWNTNSPKG